MLRKVIAFCFLLSCSSVPYVTIRPIGTVNELAWFNDGPDIVITAHNPTNLEVDGVLHCTDDDFYLPVHVPPHGEWNGIGQVMNREVHAQPCWMVYHESK